MGRRPKWGRKVSGVLVLDKPLGITSNAALQRAKRLFFANRAGHTGSLDPAASGVLPICFGEATKFSQYLLDADKTYRVVARFGMTTDSGDLDGQQLTQLDTSTLTESKICAAMPALTGDIEQIPPMYSALKRDGQPLYKLAREGITVDRDPRPVTIYSFQLLSFTPGVQASAEFEVSCSKGTYIRTLIEDLGAALECGACVSVLRRTQAAGCSLANAITLDQLEAIRGDQQAEVLDQFLRPMGDQLENLPRLEIEASDVKFFMQGQVVKCEQAYHLDAEGDIVRVFQKEGQFLGTGERIGALQIKPKRLVVLE